MKNLAQVEQILLGGFPYWEKKVSERIDEIRAISQEKWGVSMAVKIEPTLRGLSTYGSANFSKKRIRTHKYLLCEFGDVYIEDVVVHEYAHIVIGERSKRGDFSHRALPHGREFKDVCSHFGIDGGATTDLYKNSKWIKEKRKEKLKKTRVFYYSCGCNNFFHEMTIRKHSNMQRGSSRKCTMCKTRLTFHREKFPDTDKGETLSVKQEAKKKIASLFGCLEAVKN